MKVLITGGCGLVGIHAAKAFAENGNSVVCLDRRPSTSLQHAILGDCLANVRFVQADICRSDDLAKILSGDSFDGVVHSAALINESYSRNHPLETETVNVHGTATVAEALRKAGVRRLVYTSSATVYGPRNDGRPIGEDEARPAHVYGYSKFLAEQWLHCYSKVYDFQCTIVRLSSVYGPGKAFNPDRYPKQRLCAEAMAGATYTLPEGGDYARDFTYASDVGHGVFLAFTRAPAGMDTFNIAAGQLHTLREVVESLNDIFPRARLSAAPGRFENNIALSGSSRGALDIAKARSILGFQPRYSLTDGLRAYTAFLADHPPVPVTAA